MSCPGLLENPSLECAGGSILKRNIARLLNGKGIEPRSCGQSHAGYQCVSYQTGAGHIRTLPFSNEERCLLCRDARVEL